MPAAVDRADTPMRRRRPGSARLLAQVLLRPWNHTVHLPRRLISIIDQRLADIEVLVIDHGAHWRQILQAMLRVSWRHTARCGAMPGCTLARKPRLWRRLIARGFRRRDD